VTRLLQLIIHDYEQKQVLRETTESYIIHTQREGEQKR